MKNPLNKVGIQFGIILSIYYIIFNCALFFTDVTLFANKIIGMVNIAFFIIIGVITIFMARRKAGGFVTFREAFTPYFISIAIGITVKYLLLVVLFNVVDPSANDTLRQIMMEMQIETLTNLEIPQDQINEQIEAAKNLDQFSPKSTLSMWAIHIVINSILGFLLAAVFRNKSEFTQPTTTAEENKPQQ
ncbi:MULTISPECIES: DUF4199 domain-containing protein [Myroides]|uniref:DUF4199 family protein n=1 Tax=Myroides albus TaxID=2562892 RepID=A0A6I3LJG5_9FLAO|nr:MULTISPECIES: DUF4199 domain-containing protein [Myroides]MTG97954.1 DUF4199 family protein [Myroides albus]MVX36716.1 DUF4199 family protein [Myroides sp. LoEW2-1]UVD80244.1 DUF4199 domain-containing protein [Myroides albus]